VVCFCVVVDLKINIQQLSNIYSVIALLYIFSVYFEYEFAFTHNDEFSNESIISGVLREKYTIKKKVHIYYI
jgi:hypothetical protein